MKQLNQIYNMEDFYENNLLPKMFAFPHQYVARIIANNNNPRKSSKANELKDGESEEMSSSEENHIVMGEHNKMNKKAQGADINTHTSTPIKECADGS